MTVTVAPLTLDTLVVGLERALPAARAYVATPEAALATARRLLVEDPDAVADFGGRADLLAGWLRHEAARGRPLDDAALAEPVDPGPSWIAAWERSESLRAEFGGDRETFLAYCRHEQRHGRTLPEAQVPAPRRARAPAPAVTTTTLPRAVPAP